MSLVALSRRLNAETVFCSLDREPSIIDVTLKELVEVFQPSIYDDWVSFLRSHGLQGSITILPDSRPLFHNCSQQLVA